MLIDNHIFFIPLTYYLGSTAGGSTPLRTLKNNKVYQILQNGEFYLKIQQSPQSDNYGACGGTKLDRRK